ncbi:MAG: hypothetical protein SGI74_11535 [Oligoflexia bacterium]|nr:hypothetical protein [Oligoflexia bacterium]
MKRLILIIIAVAVAGKLFALLITSIVHGPSEKIKGSQFFDKMTNEQIQQNKFSPQVTQPLAKTSKVVTTFKNTPVKLNNPIKLSKTEKAQVKKVKLAQAKKVKTENEKKRRKKRRKKLEDVASKKSSGPKFTVINTDTSDDPMSQNNNGFGVGAVITSTTPAPTPAKPKVKSAATGLPTPQVGSVNVGALTIKLINTPTYADMTTIIKYYQEHRISSAEYYNVISQMQTSENVDSRRLAVMGASLEQNVNAFQALSKATIDEDASTRETASQALKSYENITSLSIISEALVNGVLVSKITASNILNEVAKGFQANPDPNQRTLFSPFVDILNPLVEDGSSPDLQASASTTLSTIKSIIQS